MRAPITSCCEASGRCCARFLALVCCASLLLSAAVVTPARGQAILTNWEGISGPNGTVPPDVHGAPGPEGVLATVNLQISYYTKAGALTWGPINLQTFWSTVGTTANGLSDPKVIFDRDSRRFFVIMQENTGSQFWLNVAVSRDADPSLSDATEWLFYRLDATEYAASNPVGGINYGGDYPGLAIDSRALYVTFRMYAFNPNGTLNGAGANYLNTALLILNKTNLLNGGATVVSLYQNAFDLQPVTAVTVPRPDQTPDNVVYMVENSGAASITLYAVNDPLGARIVTTQSLAITDRGTGVGAAPQAGSAATIPTIDRTLGNASLLNGDVWFCATVGSATTPPAPPGRAVAAFYRVRLNGWPLTGLPPALIEDNTVGSATEWNFCPSIGMNVAGDVVITWTRSSPTIFPTIAYATRGPTDNNFGTPQNIAPTVTVAGVAITNTANNDGRWGDYFSTWPDPNDGTLWIANEWTRTDTGTWSTWWAQVSTPVRDSYVNLNANYFEQNGTMQWPWLRVTQAHATITRGTIFIAPGRYNEPITLNKSVTLRVNGDGPVVVGAP